LLGGHAAPATKVYPIRQATGVVSPTKPRTGNNGKKSTALPKGLVNVGNSCYANAALQCLLSTALTYALLDPKSMHKFRRFASNPANLLEATADDDSVAAVSLSRKEQRRKQKEERKMAENSAWLTRELTAITKAYRRRAPPPVRTWFGPPGGVGAVINPGNITKHPDRLSTCLRPYQQEDAHEFLRALLSTLTMNGHNTQLSSLFDGLLESAVTCQTCDHSSLTRDRYMDLSFDISHPRIRTLEDALTEFTKTELLQDQNMVHCEKCKCKRSATKGLRLATAPSILVCHLKRFAYDRYGHVTRLNKQVTFPTKLESMSDYMSKINHASPPPYELVAVLVHQGHSCDSGHYLAYIKSGNSWYKANDSSITKVSLDQVLSQQAYILVYEVAGMRTAKSSKSSLHDVDAEADDAVILLDEGDDPTTVVSDSSLFQMLCGSIDLDRLVLSEFCGSGHVEVSIPQDDGDDGVFSDGDLDDVAGNESTSSLRKSTSAKNLKELERDAKRAYKKGSSSQCSDGNAPPSHHTSGSTSLCPDRRGRRHRRIHSFAHSETTALNLKKRHSLGPSSAPRNRRRGTSTGGSYKHARKSRPPMYDQTTVPKAHLKR